MIKKKIKIKTLRRGHRTSTETLLRLRVAVEKEKVLIEWFKTFIMSTSLSRQLEQLRTVSQTQVPVKDGATSIASLGPNLLETQLGAEQLTLLAKEALETLASTCPVLGNYRSVLFKDDPHDPLPEEDEEMDEVEKEIEDLLFLLSPFLLKPPAQYLLQYMVARHGVHVKYAETLLFSLIPYYEYTIFHRMVNALPTRFGKATAEEEFPRWVENFKHACHPATSVGLVRHVASDLGFFKLFCHVWVQKLLRHHISRYILYFIFILKAHRWKFSF